MISKEAFVKLIVDVESVYDPYTEFHYGKFAVDGDYIHFHKLNSGSHDQLHLKNLYDAYLEKEVMNRIIMESYIRKQFASLAFELLKAAGLYDKNGNR